jgi:hypothetical protein
MSGGPENQGAGPGSRSVKLLIRDGYVRIANGSVPTGRYGPVKIIQINNVPPDVTDQEVCQLYSCVVDTTDITVRNFRELGNRVFGESGSVRHAQTVCR